MTWLATKLRRIFRREDGSASVEFVILFPFFISIFGSAFEASIVTMRQVLLIQATDRVVRDLQLGNMGSPTHAEVKQELCNLAGFIPDCMDTLHVELERISTDNFEFREGAVQCVDVENDITPSLNFTNGTSNELMLVTVCATFRPMVPVTGLGLKLPKVDGVNYGLTAFSAFVVEPA